MRTIRFLAAAAVLSGALLAVGGQASADSCWWERDSMGNWRYVCVA